MSVAVGSSEANARLCGVRVERTLLWVYALCGLCAGVVGVLQFGELACGLPTASSGLELQVIVPGKASARIAFQEQLRLSRSPIGTALAQASEVLPTPPLSAPTTITTGFAMEIP